MHLLLQGMILPLRLQVDAGHLTRAFDDLTPQPFALPLVQPFAHQIRDQGAPAAGRDNLLEVLQGVEGQGVRTLVAPHGYVLLAISMYHTVDMATSAKHSAAC